MANGLVWVIFILLADRIKHTIGADAGLFILLPFSLPLATCLILPSTGPGMTNTHAALVLGCIWIGLNCFVWGYGIACIVGLFRRPQA